jgi:hypothetical protein
VVGSPSPGSLRGKSGRFNILRVPNFLLEPRGNYLGERIEAIDRLNKARSIAGTVILIGMIIYYSGLSHLATTTVDGHGTPVHTVTAASPEGHWIVGVVVSVTVAVFLMPVASLALVVWTKPGFRRASLYQLRWPLLGIAAYFGLLAAMAPILSAVGYLTSTATRHLNLVARAAGTVVSIGVALILLVWLVKALYFAATGLFRADDGHPLLALVVAPLVALSTALIMGTQSDDGLRGVPAVVGRITEFGGPASIIVLSLLAGRSLKKRYGKDFPFRRGPVAGRPAPEAQPGSQPTAA